jgi:hypothetical protein
VIKHFSLGGDIQFDQGLGPACAQSSLDLDPLVTLGFGSLKAPAAPRTMRANVLNVNCRRDDFHVGERELGTLSDDLAIDEDKGTAIVIEPVSVTALLVRVEIDASELHESPVSES